MSKKLTTEQFIHKAREIHGDYYDYSLVVYVNARIKVKIICPIHGIFKQSPRNHLSGQGCPKCKSIISKPEIELQNFVKTLGFDIDTNNRKILNGKELDIYIPSLNKAIEFNGMWWHYNNKNKYVKPKGYHAMKSKAFKDKGVRILFLREDLWKTKRKKMENIIIKFLNGKGS